MTACRYCEAAWPGVLDRCEHDDREAGVARQLAGQVHETDSPTDEQVGWFMEDAEQICAVVTDAEPVVKWMPRSNRIRVGAVTLLVSDEGGLTWRDPK
jgi:hypothetical protein